MAGMVTLRVLCDGWRRKFKDEDGDWFTERYKRGDTVEVKENEAKKLLGENGARRRQFVEADSKDDPFKDGASEEESDESSLSHEEKVNTTQEGKPAGSSMPRVAPKPAK